MNLKLFWIMTISFVNIWRFYRDGFRNMTWGRVLWLTIDFLLIERFLVAFIRQTIYSMIRFSRWAHHNIKYAGTVFMIVGVVLLWFVYWLQKGGF